GVAAADYVFDAAQRISARDAGGLCAGYLQVDRDAGLVGMGLERAVVGSIDAGPAVDEIVIRPAAQQIVAIVAEQRIISGPAEQRVVAPLAMKRVVAGRSSQLVSARSASLIRHMLLYSVD